ncbi:MAG: hypothetical protein NZ602_03430 [Thermoguttaceae bacterium]|nr:hypothetical protein [Thermoguttaceae bacterium]
MGAIGIYTNRWTGPRFRQLPTGKGVLSGPPLILGPSQPASALPRGRPLPLQGRGGRFTGLSVPPAFCTVLTTDV